MTHTVVIVPGLRPHVENHWQTMLAANLPNARTVPSFDREKLDLAGRIADLEQVVREADGPVIIVAHSAGVLVTTHWAAKHDTSRVQGALLATPPDLINPLPAEYPSLELLEASGWLPVPGMTLPFPSIVAGSTNDPLGDIDRVRGLAVAWGSRFENVGPVGHLNPAAGFGEWLHAEVLIGALR
ncbi:MAG: alpha/beta hydrolase [Nocardiaceae bacterium]|nr:alpha/beta hydrolase [Nocardiaceae bacterium]